MTMLNPPYSATMSAIEAGIAIDEGYRSTPYRCSAGKLTIGYGYNLDAGMPEDEALVLMRYRLAKIHGALAKRLPWYLDASPRRQRALLNMAYQMGVDGLLAFKKMLAACAAGDWPAAVAHALNSKWARTDSPERAARVAESLRRG